MNLTNEQLAHLHEVRKHIKHLVDPDVGGIVVGKNMKGSFKTMVAFLEAVLPHEVEEDTVA